MPVGDVVRFLSHLAVEGRVAASTQNQAFSALLFLFRHVLHRDLDVAGSVRTPVSKRIPVVLSGGEIRRVLWGLGEPYGLMARVVYGCGVRLQECLDLRIRDLDLAGGVVVVWSGKGDRDRRTVLPESLQGPLLEHLDDVRRLHEGDRRPQPAK